LFQNNTIPQEELFYVKDQGLSINNFNSNPMVPSTMNNFYNNNNNIFGSSNAFALNNGFSATNGFMNSNNLNKFKNKVKGKLVKGSISTKNKENKDSYRTAELMVKYFLIFFLEINTRKRRDNYEAKI